MRPMQCPGAKRSACRRGVTVLLSWLVARVLLTPATARAQDGFGVLVLAHGGSAEWDAAVEQAVAPLRERWDIEVAFGMADAVSIQRAVGRLEAAGIRRIGVVRLFVSGDSWRKRTEQILGLEAGAPDSTSASREVGTHMNGEEGMSFFRIQTHCSFAISAEGLASAPGMGAILAGRAAALSRDPRREDVLILAHGPGDDAQNARWVARIDERADMVRNVLPFRRVSAMTLREDWPEKRRVAEDDIRAFVDEATREGVSVIVIPYRVFGFGPYAEVLEGRPYVSDGQGLLPHPAVGGWIARQVTGLENGPFRRPAPLFNRRPGHPPSAR